MELSASFAVLPVQFPFIVLAPAVANMALVTWLFPIDEQVKIPVDAKPDRNWFVQVMVVTGLTRVV